jgi:tetratricopeptide (TPR) repeat protein
MSDLELSMLPPFCQVWGRHDEAGTDAWVAKLKITNIHHVCKGLNHVNHAVISADNEKKLGNAQAGIGEFTYVIEHKNNESFPLKAFVLINRAKLYAVQGDNDKAIGDFKAALKENPKYDKVYYELSEFYKNNKEYDLARSVIKEGLNFVPNSKLLNKKND